MPTGYFLWMPDTWKDSVQKSIGYRLENKQVHQKVSCTLIFVLSKFCNHWSTFISMFFSMHLKKDCLYNPLGIAFLTPLVLVSICVDLQTALVHFMYINYFIILFFCFMNNLLLQSLSFTVHRLKQLCNVFEAFFFQVIWQTINPVFFPNFSDDVFKQPQSENKMVFLCQVQNTCNSRYLQKG